MRLKVKIVHLYEEVSGVSQSSGMAFRNRDVKLQVLREDGSASNEEFFAKINNPILLDSPAIHEGVEGIASLFWVANEGSYNGRVFRNNRCTMNGFTPQDFAAQQPEVESKPSAAPCEKAAVPALSVEGEKPEKLPF